MSNYLIDAEPGTLGVMTKKGSNNQTVCFSLMMLFLLCGSLISSQFNSPCCCC
jgi:hypothetical protein